MQYLTPKQYMIWRNMTRQNFWQKIKRGTIPSVYKEVKTRTLLIPVEDTELESVNINALTE